MIKRRFDIAVIGGGVSGIGIAMEAAYWGFDVVLLERAKLGSGTSANSHRIIHGGLRYLQSFDLPRVRQSAQAQEELLRRFPGIIHPLPCLMPLESRGLRSRFPMSVASKLYDIIAAGREHAPGKSAILSADQCGELEPGLASLFPLGAFLWYDAFVNDVPALIEELRRQCISNGVHIAEETRVTTITRAGQKFSVQYDRAEGEGELEASVCINAAGPWIDTIKFARRKSHDWCRGFNLVFESTFPLRHALGLRSKEGRLFFLVPRGNQIALGTQYLPLKDSIEDVRVSEAEKEEFIAGFNESIPGLQLSSGDLVATELGVLPVAGWKNGLPRLKGSEEIKVNEGYIEVLSTKFTTFLPQARRVLGLAAPFLEAKSRRRISST